MGTTKNFGKERWETMTGTAMSQILPEGDSLEIENSLEADGQPERTGQHETPPVPQRRVSNRQRRLSQHLSASAENRRPQTCICQLRSARQAGRVRAQARKPQNERVGTA